MAVEGGIKVLLKVGNGATSETFTTLAGQKMTTFGGSTNVADTTDKSNSGWQTGLATTISGNVSCSGNATWDATLERVRTSWHARTTLNCELILNDNGDKYAGPFYVTSFQIDGEVNDATQYSIELQPAAALTYTAAT
jgi:TP901-1 family phage major tail protein